MTSPGKAIVIGTGFGGLASALRLRKLGHDVTVLERCHQPGGRAQTFTLGGTPFDAGPTVVTAPYLFAELFEMFGKDIADYVEIKPLEPVWYRYNFKNGFEFDYGNNEYFIEQLRQHFPQEVEGYRKLYKHAERIFDLGYEKLADTPFHNIGFMLKNVPAILKFNGYRSVYGLITKYIKSPELVQALCTPPLLLGGNPKTASSIYFLIHILEQKYGVHYAMGGTGQLVRSLCTLAREEGVTFSYNTTVTDIETQGRDVTAVRDADGQQHKAESFVFNGDPAHFYSHIAPRSDQDSGLLPHLRTKIQQPSMGLVVVYFKTSKRYDDVQHHTIGFSENYDHILKTLFARRPPEELPEDLSFYLHRPAATDPEVTNKNEDAFYVLVPVPNLRHNTDYDYSAYADTILSVLEERLLPDLRKHLTHMDYVDPAYFQTRLLSRYGAGFSLQPTLAQSAWFRYHNKGGGYNNLYFVGAGTHPGAGLPGVVNSAKIIERLYRNNNTQ